MDTNQSSHESLDCMTIESCDSSTAPVIPGGRRDTIKRLIARKPVDRCGFWLGDPTSDAWPILHRHFGTQAEEELRQKVGDDCRWISPQYYSDVYSDPEGREMFDTGLDREKHAGPPLAQCETIEEVDQHPWPNPEYLNFETCINDLKNAGDVYRMSGFWTCFYHNVMDLLGMEEYLIKMHTHPEIVHAITDRVCEFYYEANERFFKAAGDLVDGFFFGNDFGTQQSLICGPKQFREFILPWFQKFTKQGKQHGYQIILHSCGSIFDVMPDLIEAGVDCFHPIQALATNMDADTLAENFGGQVTFMGGIDAQQLLTFGSAEEVAAEVERVKSVLAPYLIVSPSHEAILPNVPPANVEALAKTAAKGVNPTDPNTL